MYACVPLTYGTYAWDRRMGAMHGTDAWDLCMHGTYGADALGQGGQGGSLHCRCVDRV